MVDLELVKVLFSKTKGRVRYRLGAKAPSLDCCSSDIHGIDCSGWVRWVLHRAGVTLPDGSQEQWAYVRDVLKWREVQYADLHYAEQDPSRLFIAFKRRGSKGHGHVWLVCGGNTMESFSDVGVGTKPWLTRKGIAAACYEVPVK